MNRTLYYILAKWLKQVSYELDFKKFEISLLSHQNYGGLTSVTENLTEFENENKAKFPIKAKLLLFLFFIFSSSVILAQSEIEGNVTYKKNAPLIFASVSVLKPSDSTLIKIVLSDSLGNFHFVGIEFDTFLLRISHIETRDTTFLCNSRKGIFIQLQEADALLQNVTVTSLSKTVEVKTDRIVFNPQNLVSIIGSNAFDLLNKAPLVTAKENGQISLRGVSGTGVMINGRMQNLSSEQLMDYLKSIPADEVQKIEIITNPSSKYEAQGLSGLLNIVVSNGKKSGLNSNVSLFGNQNTYFKYGATSNLNYRTRKLNVFFGVSYTRGDYYSLELIDNIYSRNIVPYFYSESGSRLGNKNTFFGRAGFDYTINKKSSIGLTINSNKNLANGFEQNDAFFSKSTLLDSIYRTKIGYSNSSRVTAYNINYSNSIDNEGQILTADIDFYGYKQPYFITSNSSDRFNDQAQIIGDRIAFINELKQNIQLVSVKVDYSKPISEKVKLSSGMKYTHIESNNTINFSNISNGTAINDVNKSTKFNYVENNIAGYFNTEHSINEKLSLQIGLRAENTNLNGLSLANSIKISQNYLRLFPSIFFNITGSENNQFSISYTKRIGRPAFGDLNPFKYYSTPNSYSEGNPYLRPAFTNSFDVSYTYKQAYYFNVFLYLSKDEMAEMPTLNSLNNSFKYSPINLGRSFNAGFSGYLPFNFKEWWQCNLSLSAGINGAKFSNQDLETKYKRFNFQLQVANEITLSEAKKIYGESTFIFQPSGVVQGVYTLGSYADLSFGLKKVFSGKRLTISLNATDLLNQAFVPSKIDNNFSYSLVHGTRDIRGLRVGVSYKLGKLSLEKPKASRETIDEEKNRIK